MYRAQALYYTSNKFELTADLSWVRWNDFGFILNFQHNPQPGGLRELGCWYNEELLWWHFLWFNGHFKLAWKKKPDTKQLETKLVHLKFGQMPVWKKRYF